MRRNTKVIVWITTPAALLLVGFLLLRSVIYDWDAKPYCHKQMTSALRVWSHDQTPNAYPNVEGSSLRSMGVMAEQFVVTNQIFRDYHYVPGLQEGDPPDLALFYFNKPTRWRFHVRPEARWKPKTWIVVPIDSYAGLYGQGSDSKIDYSGPYGISAIGEESYSLTTEQFTNRLIATLSFLRTNNRPNWQAVVREHTAFLDSISKKP